MLAIINVEGMENELKNIIKMGNELRKQWYLENYDKISIKKKFELLKSNFKKFGISKSSNFF